MKYTYLMNGKSLKLDIDKCFGCGMCVEVCPHNVFRMADKKAVIQSSRYCMECGACKMNCPVNAIDVTVGVGCAAAIISGLLNKTAPSCGCSDEKGQSTCCN